MDQLTWIAESPARWNTAKAELIGELPEGIFSLGGPADGDLLPGEWWRADRGDVVVGYGWMDVVAGDAEVLLAVSRAHQSHGVGTFIMEQLEHEASVRGLNYLYNAIRKTHPDAARLETWLVKRGFETRDGERLERRVQR